MVQNSDKYSETVQCPTYEWPEEPLFTHVIPQKTCNKLQGQFYHKCGKCIFRNAAANADFEFAEAKATEAVSCAGSR